MGLVMYLKRDEFLQSEEFSAYQRGLQRGDPAWLDFVRPDVMSDGYLVTFRDDDLFRPNRRLPEALLRLGDHVSFHCTLVGAYREGRYDYRPSGGHQVTFVAVQKVEWMRDKKQIVTVVTFTGKTFGEVRMAYEAFRMGKRTPSHDWTVAEPASEGELPKKGDSGQHALDLNATSVTPHHDSAAPEKQVA